MARTSNRVMRENALRVLMVLQEASAMRHDHEARISHRQIAARLQLSVQQVRLLCVRLEELGLVAKVPRYAEDGGQLSNAYTLTSRGRRELREARKLKLLA